MRKLLTVAFFLVVCAVMSLSSGCVFDGDHNARHWHKFTEDVHRAHHFIDRHFFHYDRSDPDHWGHH